MRDWALGSNGKWVTMGIPSDGQYGIPKDTMFGFPVTTANGEYQVVDGLAIDDFSRERINLTLKELQEEQDGVKHLALAGAARAPSRRVEGGSRATRDRRRA